MFAKLARARRVIGFVAVLGALTLSSGQAMGTGIESSKYELQQVTFKQQSKGKLVFVSVFRFESRAGSAGIEGVEHANAAEPKVMVFGCMLVQSGSFIDYACGNQSANALTMAPDMSKATIQFKGKSKYFRRTFTGYFTTTGSPSTSRTPSATYELPDQIGRTAHLETVLVGTGSALTSGRAVVSKLGSVTVSKARTPLSSIVGTSLCVYAE